MGVGAGLYMYDVVVKGSRSLAHILMSSCYNTAYSSKTRRFNLVALTLCALFCTKKLIMYCMHFCISENYCFVYIPFLLYVVAIRWLMQSFQT